MLKKFTLNDFRHLYPFKSHFINLNNLKYHYLDEGSGDPVVMVHGNPTWSFYFRSLVSSLSQEFRTIVPDHIGCGLSDKPDDKAYEYKLINRVNDLESFLNKLGITKNISLVVHDWGGMIGMAYATYHPDRIKKIVILNTAAFSLPCDKKLPFRLKIIRNLPVFADIAVRGFNLFAYAAGFMAAHKRLSKDVRLALKYPYNSWKNRIATLRFVQDIPIFKGDASYDFVKSVEDKLFKLKDIPMLICWGRYDFVFDLSFLKEWQRRFPEAELHLMEKAGHYILEDEPLKVSQLVRSFLIRNEI
ncbi:Cis-3-alkyl-4-alkyloxetan-2-one decarboxylase [Candidatus Magnetomoraceae bacterium gMMP-15]